ncbi:hypothetical protein P7K49_040986, partial [Saguinus oedipus]
ILDSSTPPLPGFPASLETSQACSNSSLRAQPLGGKGSRVPLRGWSSRSAGVCPLTLPFWPLKLPKSDCRLGPGQLAAPEEPPGD